MGGNAITLVSSSKYVEAGKIYNISRSAAAAVIDLSMVDCAGNARASQWTANCYMAHTAGDYKLPLVYGNAIKDGATNAAAYTGVTGNSNAMETFPRHDGNAITAPWIKDNDTTVTSAELLWQDAEGLVTAVDIDGDYLTLTVGKDATTQEGNAVVAAKDGDGNIVWSWHIWVTKQTFAEADLTTITTTDDTSTGTQGTDWHTYKVTPVNLGWVGDPVSQGYGTYYQWGRKDAFKGTGAPADANVYDISGSTVTGFTYYNSTEATIADNIKNPTTFYFVSSNPSTARYYNMWDARQTSADNIVTATVKTVYDPSPAGFCVPTGNLWCYMANGTYSTDGRSDSNWDSANKGKTWSATTYSSTTTGSDLFFPASGVRGSSSGSLINVGSSSYYWSASANTDRSGRYLYFYSRNWVWRSNNRAYGNPVRAVAEE